MRRTLSLATSFLLTLGLTVSVVGCGKSAAPRAAKAPEREQRSEATPAGKQNPSLVAPPPAYGNQIVREQTRPRARVKQAKDTTPKPDEQEASF